MPEPPLKKRKSRFGAKVTAVNESEQGEKRQAALEVAAKLGQMLGDTSGSGVGGGPIGGYMNVEGETEKMQVATDKVGAVIGKGGAKIKEIQEVTGTRMQVAREGDPNTPHLRDISITGTRENRERAKEMVNAVLAEINRFSSMFPNGCETKRIEVPINCVGLIIGKGGETIKRMKAETQCSIRVEREEEAPTSGPKVPSPGNRNVFVKGQPDGIARAERSILELVEQAGQRGGSYGGNGRGGFNQLNNQQDFRQSQFIQQGGYQPNSFQPSFNNAPHTGYTNQHTHQQPPVYQHQHNVGFQQPPSQKQQEGAYNPYRPLDTKFSNQSAQQNGGGHLPVQQNCGGQNRFIAPPQQNFRSSKFLPNEQASGGMYQPQYSGGLPNQRQTVRPHQQQEKRGEYGFDQQNSKEWYRPHNNGQNYSVPNQNPAHMPGLLHRDERQPKSEFGGQDHRTQHTGGQYQRRNDLNQHIHQDQRPATQQASQYEDHTHGRGRDQGHMSKYGEPRRNFDDRRGSAQNNSYGSERQYRQPSQRSGREYRN